MELKKVKVHTGKPKGDSYYNNVARNYEVKRKKQAWWHTEQDEMKVLLDKLPEGLGVVDIPFGTGRFVSMYLEKGYDVSGLDASGDMISAAKRILGDDFKKVDVRVGDASSLPYDADEFDLLVSTRFLRDIVSYRTAKKVLREFSRVTKQYAIIQLGQNRQEGFIPDDESPMRGSLSETGVHKLLKENRFEVIEKRLVLSHENEGTDIYHFLCKKDT